MVNLTMAIPKVMVGDSRSYPKVMAHGFSMN